MRTQGPASAGRQMRISPDSGLHPADAQRNTKSALFPCPAGVWSPPPPIQLTPMAVSPVRVLPRRSACFLPVPPTDHEDR